MNKETMNATMIDRALPSGPAVKPSVAANETVEKLPIGICFITDAVNPCP